MLNVLFFAQTRELIGEDSIQLEGDFATAEAVREHLAQKGDRWALALEKGKLLVAINQALMPLESAVKNGDEIAFFPPVTGGERTDIQIAVQEQPFDQNAVYQWLSEQHSVGATVIFVGKVRDLNLGDEVSSLYLEHYPAMTEKALREIVEQAKARWDIQRVSVIHRVGLLHTGDEIVLVGISSAHRGDAYHANEFIMDFLKSKAPFWKKEQTNQGERWIEARESDKEALEKW